MAKHPQRNNKDSSSSNGNNVSVQWQGPLPPPAALQRFDEIIPGGAERILQMAEREQAHRIQCEQADVHAGIAAHRWGQILGAAIVLIALGLATLNGLLGGDWRISVALVSLPVLSAVRALFRGRKA